MVIDHSDVGTRCLIGDVMKWYVHPILGIGISIVITIVIIVIANEALGCSSPTYMLVP